MTERLVIAGGPRAGKTTLAAELAAPTGLTPRSTDDLIGKARWGEDSLKVSGWFDCPGPWIVEGVTAARALRKWLGAHRDGKPCDRVIYLAEPRAQRTAGQASMAKSCDTVFNEIGAELRFRGVRLEIRA